MKESIRPSILKYSWLYNAVKDYTWKEDGSAGTGVIAQYVYKHFPLAVHAPDSGMWSVDYGKLTIPLIQAYKNHEDRILALESENANLKARLDAIEQRLAAIENTPIQNR